MDQVIDETTENVVLGGLILNPNEYRTIAQYIPELDVFSQKKAKALWIKVSKMIKKGEHVDTLTICSSITSDESLKATLSTVLQTLVVKPC